MAAALRSALQQELPKIIAAESSDARYDPVVRDLLRIQGSARNAPSAPPKTATPLSMENHSLLLLELLHLVSDTNLDDSTRSNYEDSLEELMAELPPSAAGANKYPNDYLSRILIDNYQQLLAVSTSYFNMSLCSQITRYLVRVVYGLECWEIYHLLLAIPNFDYFLRLVGFDIKNTSMGHMVRPPANYLNFNLRQGLQYPFPFPFYNFSYHSVDRQSSVHKMGKVHFSQYIDLRLNKDDSPKRRKRARVAAPESAKVEKPKQLDTKEEAQRDDKEDFQKHQKVFIFIHKTLDNIAQETALSGDEDDGYGTDEAMAMMEEERKSADGSVFVASIFQKVLNDYEKRGATQAIHQCRLITSDNKPCMKVFYGKNELQRHQEFVHATRKRNYKCFFCQQAGNGNQSYPRHDSLARHIRRKHGITGKENKRAVMLAREDAEKDEKDVKEKKQFVLEEPNEKRGEAAFSTFSARSEPEEPKQKEAKKTWETPKEYPILGHMENPGGSSARSAAVPETRLSYNSRPPQNYSSWLPPPKHYIQAPGYSEGEMKRPDVAYPSNYVSYAGFQPNFVPSYYKPDVYYGDVSMAKGYPVQYPFVNTMYASPYDKPPPRHDYSEMPMPRQNMYANPSVQATLPGPTQPSPKSKKEPSAEQ